MDFIYNCNFNNNIILLIGGTARFIIINAGLLAVIQYAFGSFYEKPSRSRSVSCFFLSSRSNLDLLTKFHFALPAHASPHIAIKISS